MGKSRNTYPKIHCLDDDGSSRDVTPDKKRTIFTDHFERTLTGFKVSRMIFNEIEKATHEIGYFEEDDEFSYDLTE